MSPLCGIGISITLGIPTSHNIQIGLVTGLVSRSAVAPTPAVTPISDHISSTPKPWQAFAYGITDAQAAVALRLHLGRLLHGKQGVGEVGVVLHEHGVVEPFVHAAILGRECK